MANPPSATSPLLDAANGAPPASGSGSLTGTDGDGHSVKELGKGKGTQNDRRCMRRFAVALLIVGVAATVIGILAIMGSSLPTVPFFQNIAALTSSIGAQLGSNAWTLAILTTSLGGGAMIAGIAWTTGERWIRKEKERAESAPAAEPELLSDVATTAAPTAHESDSDGGGWGSS